MTEEERLRQQQVLKPAQQGQYTNLQGISDSSRNNLNYYSQGYQPSQSVAAAQNYLQGVINQRPGEYKSPYSGQITDLYNQILNRPKFKYDVNQDPLFQQYRNQYMANGQRAMQDTVGNAAALTGGYGNSWGTTAGYQAYQEYLRQLGAIAPQLEQRAYDRYNDEGDQMRQNMDLTLNLDNIGYGRYRDTLGDWQADRDYADTAYQRERANDQDQWNNMLNYYLQQAGKENADYWNQQDLAWQREQMENENYWNQLNYDFKVRQYEDELARLAESGRGGGGGGGSGAGSAEAAAQTQRATGNVPYSQDYLDRVYEALGGAVAKEAINKTDPIVNAAAMQAVKGTQGQNSFQQAAAKTAASLGAMRNTNLADQILTQNAANKELAGVVNTFYQQNNGSGTENEKRLKELRDLLK